MVTIQVVVMIEASNGQHESQQHHDSANHGGQQEKLFQSAMDRKPVQHGLPPRPFLVAA